MAIEIKADFRRMTRAGVWSLAGILTLCAAAVGQAPVVSVGSVVPIPINSNMNQIYRILFYKGNVLALDSGSDELFQLQPGATIWNDISGPPRNSNFLGGGYNASDMAIDAQGTIYISASNPPSDAGTALFWRFPAACSNPNTKGNVCTDPNSPENSYTWHLSTAGAWGGNIIDPNNAPTTLVGESGQGSAGVVFQNSPAMDGSGTLYFSATANQIFSVQVDKDGNADQIGRAHV